MAPMNTNYANPDGSVSGGTQTTSSKGPRAAWGILIIAPGYVDRRAKKTCR
jgi:hypothetical protein